MANVRQDNVQIRLEIDGSQSRTELDNLTRKADVLKESMKGLKKGSEDYVNANKELSQVNARMEVLRNEIGLTSLSTNQLKALAGQLGRELGNLTPQTESWLNKAKELTAVQNRMEELSAQTRKVKDELGNAGSGVLDFIKKSAGFAGIQLGVQAVVSGLKQLGSESIDAAVKGSDSIADMEKALNLTTAEAKALRGQLEGIDTRTSEENLEGIAVAAGQLGIAKDQAVAFTQSVDQAVVALGDEFTGGVEDVTKSLGGLQKLFKDTKDVSPTDAITKIGSAVNALGADGQATGPVIADFTARIGQLGDLAPEITQTLGLGAAFQELGLSAEISSGGLTNVLLTASKDTAGFAKQIGLTDKEFQKLLNSDPNEVILRLADSLKGASNTDIISTLDALGVKSQEAIKVVSLLANQTDFVRGKQALASAEYEKGTSLLDEFTKKNTNSAAEVAKAEKSFGQFRRELGEMLVPVYVKLLQYGGLLLGSLRALPAFVGENKVAFGLLALAVLSFNAAQIAEQATTLRGLALRKLVALGLVQETAGTYTLIGAKELAAKAQVRLNAVMAANPIGFIITAVALLAFGLKALYDRSEAVRETFAGLASAAKFVFTNIKDVALNALGGVAGLIAGIFSFNPALIKASLDALRKTGGDLATAYHEGYSAQEKVEQAKALATKKADDQKKVEEAKAQARKVVEAAKTADEEALKNRLANIKAALALVAAGSAEELRLKKLEVTTNRDIALLDEKKSAGDKKVIRAEALRDLRQLQGEFDKKNQAAAEKRAKDEADVLKKIADLKAGLLTDETEKKIRQLQAAAEKEIATAKGTAEQVAEQLKLIEQKLALDIAAERTKQTQKRGEEELDLEKRQNALIVDQYMRREAELRTAATGELLKVLDSDAHAAEKRRLIQLKLQRDLMQLEADRVEQQRAIAERIVAIDEDIALRRIARRRQQAGELSQVQDQADADELAVRRKKLDEQYAQEYFQKGNSEEEKLAISRQYLQAKEDLEQEYEDRGKERDKRRVEATLEAFGTVIATLGDFEKINSDKQLTKLDKDKKARLLKLDQEYKAGKLSKEVYEREKSTIESNYDEKTRAIKREAAEKEKKYNIAQAIIAGALAVIRVSYDPFLAVAAGITSALGLAKIIATPIPEFAKGGVTGGPKPTWRERVRQFATGGINPVAGVPSVGQLHSGGGIRMVDGATGQHLGEWERGEPYMILSRDTYANNRELVDALLDTSLNRGGAPVRRREGGHYAEGGTPGGALPAAGGSSASSNGELLQLVRETRDAVRALPSRQHIAWGDEDTANVEDALADRQDVRDRSGIR